MGAHSAPKSDFEKTISTTGAFAAVAMALGAAVSFGMVDEGVAEAAPAADLDAIAQCESGGNPLASNGSHFGLFQFDLATWRSVGGTGDPRSATSAEQYARAQTLMNARGTQPWTASQSCWQGKTIPSPVKAQVIVKPSPVKRVPQAVVVPKVAPKPTPAPTIPKLTVAIDAAEATPLFDAAVSTVVGDGLHVVRAGDNLSDIAKAKGLPNAMHIYNLNRHILSNPDKIYPGQVLRLT